MNIHEYDEWKNWDESLCLFHVKKALEEVNQTIWVLIEELRKTKTQERST